MLYFETSHPKLLFKNAVSNLTPLVHHKETPEIRRGKDGQVAAKGHISEGTTESSISETSTHSIVHFVLVQLIARDLLQKSQTKKVGCAGEMGLT